MSKMRFSTNNIKNGDYTESHVIYVGTQTGSFKRKQTFMAISGFSRCWAEFTHAISLPVSGIDLFNDDNPYQQTNLQSLNTLTRDSKVTALSFAEQDGNDILVGRSDSVIRVYECGRNNFSGTDLDIPEGKVVGLAWNEWVGWTADRLRNCD